MFANERQNKIMEMINRNGAVTTSDLVHTFNVSTETVRRDLLQMEKSGSLSRVHGGAVKKTLMKPFLNLDKRNEENSKEKLELSKKAVSFVTDGDIIAIDSGSTATIFAGCLGESLKKLTVVTHSLDVFNILNAYDEITVILCGGHFLKNENAFYGKFALDTLNHLHIQKAFVCPSAVSLDGGIADYEKNLYDVQLSLINLCDSVYILADSSKFEKKALYRICHMKQEFCYITDSNLSPEMQKLYLENNLQIYTGKMGDK